MPEVSPACFGSTMKPRTQVVLGNWAGAGALGSVILFVVGMGTGILALQLFAVPFLIGMMVRMALDSRQDRIRINENGELHLNGRLTTVERVLDDLPLDDPYLQIQTIESKIASTGHNVMRQGPSAIQPQIKWSLWVERAYDPQQIPEQAVRLIALLQQHDVPFACVWIPHRAERDSGE
jgi:hypothetical protein